MGTTRFTSPEEFIEELERDKDMIDRSIVRLTNLFTLTKVSPNIQHQSVVATYKLLGRPNDIVRMEHFVGQLWGLERDKPVMDRAKEIQAAIEEACKRLDLEVRAGVCEE